MKKLILALALIALATTGFAQTLSTANLEYPLPTQTRIFTTAINPASTTVQASYALTMSGTAQRFPQMPAGTKTVIVDVKDGCVQYGNASITSAAMWTWPTIATSTEVVFDISPMKNGLPDIWFIQPTTCTGAVVKFTPFK